MYDEVITPDRIRAELGMTQRPFMINDFRAYLGVTMLTETGTNRGGVTTWSPGRGVRIALPPGSREELREAGSHELGHVANGDVGPHRVVLYCRGSGRGAGVLDPRIEDRATWWGMDALIGSGPLRNAVFHDEIKSADDLAREFQVSRRFIVRAAERYGVKAQIVTNADRYALYLRSPEWLGVEREILRARPICQRSVCGRSSVIAQHLRFDRFGKEQREDIEALCDRCYGELTLGVEIYPYQPELWDPMTLLRRPS